MRLLLAVLALTVATEARIVSSWVSSTYSPVTGAWKRVLDKLELLDDFSQTSSSSKSENASALLSSADEVVDSSALDDLKTLLSLCNLHTTPQCSLRGVDVTETGSQKVFHITFDSAAMASSETDFGVGPSDTTEYSSSQAWGDFYTDGTASSDYSTNDTTLEV